MTIPPNAVQVLSGGAIPGTQRVGHGGGLELPRLIIGDKSASLHSELGQNGRFEVAGAASNAEGLIELVGDLRPEVALLDILIPGDGLWATEGISRVAPDTAIVVHSADEHRPTILAFLQAGAIYHVRTGTDVPNLIDLLDEAINAHRGFQARAARNPHR